MSESKRKYPWNLLDEMFGDTVDAYGDNVIERWCYRDYIDCYDEKKELTQNIREKIIVWRAEEYVNEVLNEEEKKVVNFRLNEWTDWQLDRHYKAMPWNQIQLKMKYRSPQTGQDVYEQAMRKLKGIKRFRLLSPKLAEEEREYLLNTIEGNWNEEWINLFKKIKERVKDFEAIE